MDGGFKQKFWNDKILSWEKDKYDGAPKILDINSSVKRRLNMTADLLSRFAEGKNLVELGCGSGRLWEKISHLKLNSYTGVDFSESALAVFQKKVKNFKGFKVSLVLDDGVNSVFPADIVVSLGLFDWLSMNQIKRIAENYQDSRCMHSFSEKKVFSPAQKAHSLYVFLSYGRKVGTYIPRYRKAEDMISVFSEKVQIYRDFRLSFSAFIYNLPPYISFKNQNNFDSNQS